MVENSFFFGTWKILHCNPLSVDIQQSHCCCLEGTEFYLDENGDVVWKPPDDVDRSIPIFLCETYTVMTDCSYPVMRFYGDLPNTVLEFKLTIYKDVIYLDHLDWCTFQCVKISTTGNLQNLPYSLSTALEEGFFSDLMMLDKSGNEFRLHTAILSLSNPHIDWSESGKFFTKHNKRLPEEVLSTILYYMYTECLPDDLAEDAAKQALQVVKPFPGFEAFIKNCTVFLKSESIKQKIKVLVFDIHDCFSRIIDLFSDQVQSSKSHTEGQGPSTADCDSASGTIETNPSKLCYVISQSLRELAVACVKFFMVCDLFGKNRKDFAKEEKSEIIKFARSRLVVSLGQLENLCKILRQKFSHLDTYKKHEIIDLLAPEIEMSLSTTHEFLSQLKTVLERMIPRPPFLNNPTAAYSKIMKVPQVNRKFFASSAIGCALYKAIHHKQVKQMNQFYEKFVFFFMTIEHKRDRFSWMSNTRRSESIIKSWDQLISEDIPYFILQLGSLQVNFNERITFTEWKNMFKVASSTVSWILSKLRSRNDYEPFILFLAELVQMDQFKETLVALGLLDQQPAAQPSQTKNSHSSSTEASAGRFNFFPKDSGPSKGVILKSPIPRKDSRLPQKAFQLFESGQHTDMVFELFTTQDEADGSLVFARKDGPCGRKYVIKAHRVIMAARCNWFRRALLSGMKESIERKIKIHDVNVSAFEKFLEFLYCGCLDAKQLSAEKLTDILILSDRYEVDALRQISEQALLTHLNDDTTLYLLSISDQLDLKDLKLSAMEYIKKHTKLLLCEDFHKLTDEIQHKIYQSISWTPPRSLSPDQPLLGKNIFHSDSSTSSPDRESPKKLPNGTTSFTEIANDMSLLEVTSNPRLQQHDERCRRGDEPIDNYMSLSEDDMTRLEECVSNLREVIGESVSREELVELCLAADYDINRALNFFFSS